MADTKNPAILGQFTGKCCDANVVNNNDMHLGTELFQNLIASDEFKTALKNRHYIGFAGHPADPGCQEFKDACIVMTDMKLLDDGTVEGVFDLIDTPVGRIIKTFIDAGVTFGISIRGAGDVASDGEVDPDTFVFRGFDLVTFPAYDDCIPEFREIAASTDINKQKKFRKVCASIDNNIDKITSCEALKLIQEQFNEGSEEFNKIGSRIDELTSTDADDEATTVAVLEEQVAALTDMYVDAVNEKNELIQQLADSQLNCNTIEIACSRKIASYKRIAGSQINDLKDEVDEVNQKRRSESVKASREIKALQSKLNSANRELSDSRIVASKSAETIAALKGKLKSVSERLEENNLKYNQKIQSSSNIITQRNAEIEELKSQLSETVTASKRLEQKSSNLDAEKSDLLNRVEAAESLVLEYQQAYADMYANALGIHLDNLSITASTSVQNLRNLISASTSTSNMMSGVAIDDISDNEESQLDSIADEDDSLITI